MSQWKFWVAEELNYKICLTSYKLSKLTIAMLIVKSVLGLLTNEGIGLCQMIS